MMTPFEPTLFIKGFRITPCNTPYQHVKQCKILSTLPLLLFTTAAATTDMSGSCHIQSADPPWKNPMPLQKNSKATHASESLRALAPAKPQTWRAVPARTREGGAHDSRVTPIITQTLQQTQAGTMRDRQRGGNLGKRRCPYG